MYYLRDIINSDIPLFKLEHENFQFPHEPKIMIGLHSKSIQYLPLGQIY